MRYPGKYPVLAILALAVAIPGASTAQGVVLDRAAFVVSRGGEVVGREEFTLRRGHRSGAAGYTLTVNAFYPAERPAAVLVATIEFSSDSQPATARMDLDTGDRPSVLVALSPRVTTVRTLTPRGESARQLPGLVHPVLLDEFLLTPLMALSSRREGQLTLFYARTGRRIIVQQRPAGMGSVTVRGVERELHHVTLGSDTETHHLWYDSSGALVKVETPGNSVSAVRIPQR